MIFYADLLEKARQNQQWILSGFQPGYILEINESTEEVTTGYAGGSPIPPRKFKPHMINGIMVGIDLREWTRRSLISQLIAAGILNTAIEESLNLLRAANVLEPIDPLIAVPAGDGVFVAFTDGKSFGGSPNDSGDYSSQSSGNPPVMVDRTVFSKALSFIFTLNTLMTEYNRRRAFRVSDQDTYGSTVFPILPIHLRFSLSMERLLLCIDVTGRLNAVGPGMVTCSRILSNDHGNHFLVHDKILHACDQWDGLAAVASANNVGNWNAHLHIAEMPDVKIKSGQFRYADVFGQYSDAPLLRMRGMPSAPPKEFHIGSHNVRSLDLDR